MRPDVREIFVDGGLGPRRSILTHVAFSPNMDLVELSPREGREAVPNLPMLRRGRKEITMDAVDIPYLSATALSRLIEKKEVSPVEATEAYLDRIDALDFKFNAYLAICRRDAMQAAREAEAAIAGGNYLGPMHGIPVSVKDQLWSKGIRSTGGSTILADFIPDEDATPIAKLKEAGAILLGKTSLVEFAITAFDHRYGVPRNPWDLDSYTGGSSSGCAAATGAYLCATSVGEDTAGSIRQPASWSGLVGLRPSWGRVSRYGLMPGCWSMDTAGPMSRTVEDAAITLGAIAGYDHKDPYTWKAPVPDYRQALDGNVKGVRIGVIKELTFGEVVEPDVREAVERATSVLEQLGASVEEVSIPLADHARMPLLVALSVEAASNHRKWIQARREEYAHDGRIRLLTGGVMPAQAYYKAQKLRTLIRQQVHDALKVYDVLVSPTLARPAPRIAEFDQQPVLAMPYLLTLIYSLANSPAISVPCGFTSGHLPIGLQIGAMPGDDATILKVAHAYEQHTPWHTMRPSAV